MTQSDQFAINLSGKVAVLTGATKGIGASIATPLSDSQASAVVSDIDDESGPRLVDRLNGVSKRAIYMRADVSDAADVDRLFRETRNKFKKVDILINNVGNR